MVLRDIEMEWSCCFVAARPLRDVCCLYCMYCVLVCCMSLTSGDIGVDNSSPFQVTANVGDTVTLVCDLNNVDRTIYWSTYENSDISSNHNILVESFRDRYSIVGNESQGEFNLKIENIQIDDAKTFQCVYYWGASFFRETLVTTELLVLVPPSDDSPKCDASPTVGTSFDFSVRDRVRLQCTAIGGSPSPDLGWFSDSTLLASGTGTLQKVVTLTADQYDVAFQCVMTTPALDEPRTCNVVPLKTTPSRYRQESTTATLPSSSQSAISNQSQDTTQLKHTSLTAIDDKDPIMQNIILIGAASGGGFFLIVLLVTIIIAFICCCKKKKATDVVSKPANRPTTGEYEMVNPQEPDAANQAKTASAMENPYAQSPSKDPNEQYPNGNEEFPLYDQPDGDPDDSKRKNGGGGGELGGGEEERLVYADLDLNEATDDIIQTEESTEYAKVKV